MHAPLQDEADYTNTFRALSSIEAAKGAEGALEEGHPFAAAVGYGQLERERQVKWREWVAVYTDKLMEEGQDESERVASMNQANPKYILRNYLSQRAIEVGQGGRDGEITGAGGLGLRCD